MTGVRVKICGLKRAEEVRASVEAGASYLGFNFFERSPRYVTPDDAALLAGEVPAGIAKVGLIVNESDAAIETILESAPLDILQCHGSEAPGRVAEIRDRFGLPVMKAVGVATDDDLAALGEHARAADMLLVDAKPAPGAELPGGNGVAFDWRLVAGRRWPVPWMLAGGLTPANVAEAIRLTGANQVDVASGVENAPGVKDARLIADFIAAASR